MNFTKKKNLNTTIILISGPSQCMRMQEIKYFGFQHLKMVSISGPEQLVRKRKGTLALKSYQNY